MASRRGAGFVPSRCSRRWVEEVERWMLWIATEEAGRPRSTKSMEPTERADVSVMSVD